MIGNIVLGLIFSVFVCLILSPIKKLKTTKWLVPLLLLVGIPLLLTQITEYHCWNYGRIYETEYKHDVWAGECLIRDQSAVKWVTVANYGKGG